MGASITQHILRYVALARVEIREARGVALFMGSIAVLVAALVAWYMHRGKLQLELGPTEALGMAGLSVVCLIPVLADVFSCGERRSAQRTVARLPVASLTVFMARSAIVVAFTVGLYVVLIGCWLVAVEVVPAPPVAARPSGWDAPWGLMAFLSGAGFPFLPLISLGATWAVAQVFRHALSASIVGVGSVIVIAAMLLDPGALDRGTTLFYLTGSAGKAVASPLTPAILLLALAAGFSLRGPASRSWMRRSLRVAAVLGLSTTAVAGVIEWQEWQGQNYAFDDPEADIGSPWFAADREGEWALLELRRRGVSTAWRVDLSTGEASRIEGDDLATIAADASRSFYGGLRCRKTELVRRPGWNGDEVTYRVTREQWSTFRGGKTFVVERVHAIGLRRRAPHLAFYMDAENRLHRVDFEEGTDTVLELEIDGSPHGVQVGQEGRWVTWTTHEKGFRAVNLVSGATVEVPSESDDAVLHMGYAAAMLGGEPLLRRIRDDHCDYFVIREGEVISKEFTREYSHLSDIDGQRALAYSRDGGLYVVGPDGDELLVLREPRL